MRDASAGAPWQWPALRKQGPFLGAYLGMITVASLVFVVVSGKEMRWFVGMLVLAAFAAAFTMAKDKKLFLICTLLISLTIRTTINLWVPEATPFPTGSGTTTSAVELFAFDPALGLLFLYVLFSRGKNQGATLRITDVAALLFMIACTLSLVNSRYPYLTLVRLPVMFRLPVIYYCLSRGVTRRREVQVMSVVIVSLVLVESALSIAQTQVGNFGWLADVVKRDEQTSTVMLYGVAAARATGTIGYTTVFAQWLGMLSPLGLAIAMAGRTRLERVGAGLTYVVALVALILSLSRAEWFNIPVVFAVLFTVLILKNSPGKGTAVVSMVGLLGVLAVLIALRYDLILARLTAPDSDSAYIRIPMMAVASKVIADNPFFGVGLHNYTQVMRSYGIVRGSEFGVHNSFLYLWAETGVLGLVTVLLLWFVTVKRLVVCVKDDVGSLWPTAAGMLAGLTALLCHSLVEEGFHVHQVLSTTLWAYFGLAAAMQTIVRRDTESAVKR